MRLKPSHTLVLLIALSLLPTAQAANFAYDVEIDAPDAIEPMLRANLGLVRWQGSDYVDKPQLDRLYDATPAEIQRLLGPQGYFSPKIERTMREDGGVWHVSLSVDPGPATVVTGADIALSGPIRNLPDFQARYAILLAGWSLPIGENFTQRSWDLAKRHSLQSLVVDGFPSAHIASSHGDVDPDRASADLAVEYDSGPRFTFGPLQVTGLKRYPEVLVQRMATFKSGDTYSQKQLLDFQSALQNTPYFSNVFLDVPIDAEKPDNVPVKLEVTEAPIYKADAGLGYDTDTGARTSFGIRDADFLGHGWIGTLGLDVEQKQQIFDAGLQLPPDSDGYRYAAGFRDEHQNISGQQLWEQTLGLQRSRLRDGNEISQALQYVRSLQRINGAPGQINYALMPSQSWTHRALNNTTDPSAGTILNLQIGGAAKGFVSSASFLRSYAKMAWYIPVGSASFVRLRGEVGDVLTTAPDKVPADWLFRAGGADSVRGYGYQTLGVEQNGAVVGGRVLATASIEYQQRIQGNWRGAVFTDVGGAADRWQSLHGSKGYGVGARWASPVGPFAGDIAYGADDKRLRFHFSLGVGF
ncbi:MAG: outer membrane protein assembly factor [Burkholderiales bacterium]|nr:outer membrane protein assembly factor [Burkholderiales bacterium]